VSEAPHLVLVVEDDPDVRESLCEALADSGYEVAGAANGREALDWLKSSARRPCLIVLDLMMPVMGGEEFRALQRQDDDLSEIPVLLVSAHKEVAALATRMGVVGALPKPFKLDTLLAFVSSHC
jgi:two-component system, chemotaxis family, chemotaxis protein CheY